MSQRLDKAASEARLAIEILKHEFVRAGSASFSTGVILTKLNDALETIGIAEKMERVAGK